MSAAKDVRSFLDTDTESSIDKFQLETQSSLFKNIDILMNAISAVKREEDCSSHARPENRPDYLEEINNKLDLLSANLSEIKKHLFDISGKAEADTLKAGGWLIDEIRLFQESLRGMSQACQACIAGADVNEDVKIGIRLGLGLGFGLGSGIDMINVLDKLSVAVIVIDDKAGVLLFANKMADRLIREMSDDSVDIDKSAFIKKIIKEHIADNASAAVFHEPVSNKWLQFNSELVDWSGTSQALLYTLTDISGRKLEEEALRAKAEIDELTKAYRREAGLSVFQAAASKPRTTPFSYMVLFVDVNDFKEINDIYGHRFGDDALCSVVTAVKESLRESDIVIRWGGDEFVCILAGGDERTAEEVIKRIKQRLEHIVKNGEVPYSMTLSIGMSGPSGSPDEIKRLIEQADGNMYRNKHGEE